MHLEILNQNQIDLLPFLNQFKREFYMVGGTAISLHIGHRLSIDFDMFKKGTFNAKKLLNKFDLNKEKYTVTYNTTGQLNLICRDVKFTFFNYDFDIEAKTIVNGQVKIPNLLTLAAMKAYALGHRSKWKDYVDLYFILKDYYNFKEICNEADKIFGQLFNEKLFKSQLNYFVGINYTEEIEYMPGYEVEEQTVKNFLTEIALEKF